MNPICYAAMQDDAVLLDWRNWTFFEEASLTSGPHLECTPSSIFEGSVECLNFDKVSIVSEPCKSSTTQNTVSLDQCRIQQECAHETSSIVPHFLVNEQVRCYRYSKDVEVHISPSMRIRLFKEVSFNSINSDFCQDCETDLFSGLAGCMKKSDIEQQNIFLEERLNVLYVNGLGIYEL